MFVGSIKRRQTKAIRRGSLVLVSLLGYLAAVMGYPVPTARVRSSQPFPCQNHACGCVDAEHCWRSCCCFTPAQRFAWALANGVAPPFCAEAGETLIAADEHSECDEHLNAEPDGEHDRACQSEHRACQESDCAHGEHEAVRDHAGGAECGSQAEVLAGDHPRRSCERCRTSVSEQKQNNTPSAAANQADVPLVHFVSGEAWRKCRGQATHWVTTGAAVPPPPATLWQFSWNVVEWLSAEPTLHAGANPGPPVPPPRV